MTTKTIEQAADKCDRCGEEDMHDDCEMIECPECGKWCCCHCIAGKNVTCFGCEEGEE